MKTFNLCIVLFLFVLFLSSGCKDDDKGLFTMNAVVVWDGDPDTCNAFMLKKECENGLFVYYKPDHLPKEFEEDGLPVTVFFVPTDDTYNCGFGGEVEILIINRIKKR